MWYYIYVKLILCILLLSTHDINLVQNSTSPFKHVVDEKFEITMDKLSFKARDSCLKFLGNWSWNQP
jgi:hypothetical protein